jgi:hypothetical protein
LALRVAVVQVLRAQLVLHAGAVQASEALLASAGALLVLRTLQLLAPLPAVLWM